MTPLLARLRADFVYKFYSGAVCSDYLSKPARRDAEDVWAHKRRLARHKLNVLRAKQRPHNVILFPQAG